MLLCDSRNREFMMNEAYGARQLPLTTGPIENRFVPNGSRAIAFNVDAESLDRLNDAFPDWEIQAVARVTALSVAADWILGAADFLIIGAREDMREAVALCRELRSQPARAATPIVVLVAAEDSEAVTEALRAGANGCLVLPIHAKQAAAMLMRSQADNQPGRHTLNLDRPQRHDPWRDDGGQG